MQKQKCSLKLYTKFLTANQNRYSSTELAKTVNTNITHDVIDRWKASQNYTPKQLWQHAHYNDHFLNMLDVAKKRGFKPNYILMDSWYTSMTNLKHIRDKDWKFICNFKSNRLVSLEKGKTLAIQDLNLTKKQVKKVWLRGFGFSIKFSKNSYLFRLC